MVVFSRFTQLYNHNNYPTAEYFTLPKTILCLLTSTIHFLFTCVCPYRFILDTLYTYTLDMSYKLNHMICCLFGSGFSHLA